MRLEEVSTFD